LGGEAERICTSANKTFIFVTHDIREAVRLADVVYVMSKRPSRVKQVVRVDLPRPREVGSHEFQEFEVFLTEELK